MNQLTRCVEFYGLPRAGKTTLTKKILRRSSSRFLSRRDLGEFDKHSAKSIDRTIASSRKLQELSSIALDALASGNVKPYLRLRRACMFSASLRLAAYAEQLDQYALFDEGLLQRGLGIALSSKRTPDIVWEFFDRVPLPALTVHVKSSPDLIRQRIPKKSRHYGYLEQAAEVIERSLEMLRGKGARVLEIDASDEINSNVAAVVAALEALPPLSEEQTVFSGEPEAVASQSEGHKETGAHTVREKYYGDIAARYDARRERTKKWRKENETVASYLSRLSPAASVLDIPIGTGRFVDLYASHRLTPTGVDMSSDMLAIASDKAHKLQLGISTKQADILNIPFAANSFDCTVCVRLLNWFNEQELDRALGEIARVSRQYAIISIRVSDTATQTFTPKPGAATVHAKAKVMELLSKHQLSIIEDVQIQRKPAGSYHMLLLEAA